MQPPAPDMTPHLRLLECWLPLVQELNATYSWDAGPQQLEQLIRTAAPDLPAVSNVTAACTILVQTYQRLREQP